MQPNVMLCGDEIKAVFHTRFSAYNVKLTVAGRTFSDRFNDEEPFDRRTHVFYFPKDAVSADTVMTLSFTLLKNAKTVFRQKTRFGKPVFAEKEELKAAYDCGYELMEEEKEELTAGVEYIHGLYRDPGGAKTHVFTVIAEPGAASLYVGTPSDGYESVNVRQSIPGMINAACNNGRKIVAGTNADFFDIFGDFHPSGLCVKNGVPVANETSGRCFIALKKDGTHVITDLAESPGILPELVQAAAGYQMIVKDGKIHDFAPLEPFSFVRHPRTAAGVTADGRIILTVVDGRIPDYSNGASLVDLAKLMISFGADRALNLDGGGSSAMYTRKNGGYLLRSRPADKFRPKAKLIRKDYNSLLLEEKRG